MSNLSLTDHDTKEISEVFPYETKACFIRICDNCLNDAYRKDLNIGIKYSLITLLISILVSCALFGLSIYSVGNLTTGSNSYQSSDNNFKSGLFSFKYGN